MIKVVGPAMSIIWRSVCTVFSPITHSFIVGGVESLFADFGLLFRGLGWVREEVEFHVRICRVGALARNLQVMGGIYMGIKMIRHGGNLQPSAFLPVVFPHAPLPPPRRDQDQDTKEHRKRVRSAGTCLPARMM